MKIIQPPQESIEELIRYSITMYGMDDSTIALAVPSLDEVKEAIDAGPQTTLDLRVIEGTVFKSVKAGKNKATLKSTVKFKTLTLNRIHKLEVDETGAYSFIGVIRTYDFGLEFEDHGNRRIRSYWQEQYLVSCDPHLRIYATYKNVAGGHGTEDEGHEWDNFDI